MRVHKMNNSNIMYKGQSNLSQATLGCIKSIGETVAVDGANLK